MPRTDIACPGHLIIKINLFLPPLTRKRHSPESAAHKNRLLRL